MSQRKGKRKHVARSTRKAGRRKSSRYKEWKAKKIIRAGNAARMGQQAARKMPGHDFIEPEEFIDTPDGE